MASLAPLESLPATRARAVEVVFADVDDTLTTHGRLRKPAFSALWDLSDAGIHVVPVTGGPAGWCDHMARVWPVTGAIGENGALYYAYDPEQKTLLQHYALDEEERKDVQSRLAELKTEILRTVPGARLAKDQAFRLQDLAIDYAQDGPRLSDAAIDAILDLFQAAGAQAKMSSIHINGWFGTYDKVSMMKRFAADRLGLDLDVPSDRARTLYIGDAPNDEPAFAFFDLAVGVANIRRFETQLTHRPRYITRSEAGEGFHELASTLLSARGPKNSPAGH